MRIDPVTSAVDVYNLPGDDNGLVGIGCDGVRGRIWFTQARRSTGIPPAVAYEARLTSFDPTRIAPDPDFDFVPAETCVKGPGAAVGACSATAHRRCITDHDCVLAEQVCPPGATDDGACFHEYELPAGSGVSLPAHVLVHSDGSIWYSAYWGGNHLGRLDPATGEILRFPLPDPPGRRSCDYGGCDCFFGDPAQRCPTHCCLYLLLGWGPWSLLEDEGGAIVTCGQTSLSVARLDTTRLASPECRALDGSGRNPCLTEWRVPFTSFEADLVHSVAADGDGNVWVTWSPNLGHHHDPASPASIGFLDRESGHILALPPLSLYGFVDSAGAFLSFGGAGIAGDAGGSIWFADYFRHRVGRVRRL